MATDPATTTPETLKKKLYYAVAIDLGSTRTGTVVVRGDIADYFNISTDQVATGGLILRTRKAHTRQRFSKGLDGAADTTPISVPKSEWYDAPDAPTNRVSGQAIKVPTELKLSTGTIRSAIIHFPGAATKAVISAWLHEKCTAHRPTKFYMPGGKGVLVVPKGNITDLNPGNKKPDAAPAPGA